MRHGPEGRQSIIRMCEASSRGIMESVTFVQRGVSAYWDFMYAMHVEKTCIEIERPKDFSIWRMFSAKNINI